MGLFFLSYQNEGTGIRNKLECKSVGGIQLENKKIEKTKKYSKGLLEDLFAK